MMGRLHLKSKHGAPAVWQCILCYGVKKGISACHTLIEMQMDKFRLAPGRWRCIFGTVPDMIRCCESRPVVEWGSFEDSAKEYCGSDGFVRRIMGGQVGLRSVIVGSRLLLGWVS